ncbi:hypothetical protein OG874_43260 [Nocardia sp. NBC_00565]|uniref:hypothetical protein n=1 Tax=Nocardia sp. NBC_00565 TaxID=2975993 RepID=UPI002E82211A|nr:hypothetical protein [Nocardia sp. NBC_00565]WUC08356.1 hypothetical protein OG874_43260 [Nocardia sp. NBC_00565]
MRERCELEQHVDLSGSSNPAELAKEIFDVIWTLPQIRFGLECASKPYGIT